MTNYEKALRLTLDAARQALDGGPGPMGPKKAIDDLDALQQHIHGPEPPTVGNGTFRPEPPPDKGGLAKKGI